MNDKVRRIVTIDNPDGKSFRLSDGPVATVVTDPARSGFQSFEIWAVGAAPLSGGGGTPSPLGLYAPPPGGSLCRVLILPPEGGKRVTSSDAEAFFTSMGAPIAARSPVVHPYMLRTSTLDFCLILEGRVTLVLDTGEVDLEAGDTVIQLGARHAWSNRSSAPCRIAITMVDGALDA